MPSNSMDNTAIWLSSATVPNTTSATKAYPFPTAPHAGLESTGTEALFNLSIRHNPVVEGIRSADYNYRSADTDLFAETDNQTIRRICRQHRLTGQTTTLGPSSQNPDEAKVQTTC